MKTDDGSRQALPHAPDTPRPRLRNLAALLLLLFGLALYALLVMQIGPHLAGTPIWIQTPFYLLAGLAWLWPARRLLAWMANASDGRSGQEVDADSDRR